MNRQQKRREQRTRMKLIAIYKEVEKLENRSSSKQAGRQQNLSFSPIPVFPLSFFLFCPLVAYGLSLELRSTIYEISTPCKPPMNPPMLYPS
jgi:hypothetical protein